MESRRRTLISDGPAGNNIPSYSAIPIPSSVVKLPSRSGATQGSGASSLSIGTNTFGLIARPNKSAELDIQTSARKATLLPARVTEASSASSATRGDAGAYGRTPQTGRNLTSARRSSIFPSMGARSSMVSNTFPSTLVKDLRPLRDRTYQVECQRNIHEYLNSRKIQLALSPKWGSSPTQRDFQIIFRFLAEELLEVGFPWGKKFDDDCISILRDLRYPALDTTSKTALTAPGSPHAWPPLLAMLSWIVELCKAQTSWYDHEVVNDPLVCPANELRKDHPHIEDCLLWEFSSKTYREWFDGGAEVFPLAEHELEEAFEQIAITSINECDQLEIEINKRDVELRQLQAQEPPLKTTELEYVQLMSDKTKFIGFIDLHRQKAEKLKQANGKARAAVVELEHCIAVTREELLQTELAVSAQNVSPDEANRMNHERETLSRNLEDIRSKIAETTQHSYDQEMLVTRSMDRFDQLLQDYSSLSLQIGDMQSDLSDLPYGINDVDDFIEIDLGAKNLNEIKDQGRKKMEAIRPILQTFCEMFRSQSRRSQDSAIILEDEQDRISQHVERQKEEVANLEMRLRLVHEQTEEAKHQLQSETSDANRTVAKLETEVSAMSTASQQGVLTTQSHLEGTRIAFKELRHKTQQLQEAVVTQLMGHVDVVIKVKEHTAKSLKGIRNFAEAQ